MRINSSARRARRLCLSFCFAVGTLLPVSAPVLHAQCTDDDPDSIACQMQQPAPSSTPSSDSPAVFNAAQGAQPQPHPDRSNEATASGSLPSGAVYTENPPQQFGAPPSSPQPLAPQPEPPTEFQRFVESTTGQMLPVFGAALFLNPQPLFAPVQNAPAPENLIVGAGDELRIRIWGQVNFSANLRVSREGEIYLPKVGAIHVAGLPLAAVQDHLRQALDRIYRNYEISVDVGAIHSFRFI
jgi:hypothetical protein